MDIHEVSVSFMHSSDNCTKLATTVYVQLVNDG